MIGQPDDDDDQADECLALRLLHRFERLRKGGYLDGAERALDELKRLAVSKAPLSARPDRDQDLEEEKARDASSQA